MLPDGERDEVYTWLLSRGLSTAYKTGHLPARLRDVGTQILSSRPRAARRGHSRLFRSGSRPSSMPSFAPGAPSTGSRWRPWSAAWWRASWRAASRPQLAAAIRLRLVARLVACRAAIPGAAGRGCRAPGAGLPRDWLRPRLRHRLRRAGRLRVRPGPGAAGRAAAVRPAAPGLALRRSLTCGRPYPGGPESNSRAGGCRAAAGESRQLTGLCTGTVIPGRGRFRCRGRG